VVEAEPVRLGAAEGAPGDVTLLDGDTGLPAQVKQVAASPAAFTTALDVANLPEIRVAALSVTADSAVIGALPVPSASHESFLLSSGTAAGGGAAWRVYSPQDFSGSTLTASFTGLGAGEQVAVMLVNTDGDDNFVPQVTVTGVPSPPARLAEPLPASLLAMATGAPPEAAVDRRQGIEQAHEALRRWDAARLAAAAAASPVGLAPATAAAPVVPAVVGDARTFCHAFFQLGTGGQEIVVRRRGATLRHVSGQAQFWVTDEVWPAFQTAITDLPLFWSTVGGAYDGPIKSALGTYFGDESDIDANGQMMFVFASLGSVGNAFPVGYFTPGDTLTRDASANCTGSGSNHADALYLTDPATFTSKGFPADDIRDVEYPGTMAHELQHNVNYNERCVKSRVLPGCTQFNAEDDWVNEGLSMVSEDAAGFGLATTLTTSEFRRVGNYLRVYRDYSLTRWEGDPAGNYGGVHAFMRYWLDQQGPAFTKQVVSSGLFGRTGIEKVLGVPLETAMIRFANALVFSGETFSPLPAWDYASGPGVPWSPLHQVLKWDDRSGATPVVRDGAYVDYTPLPAAPASFLPLRADGWGLYLTGKGTGGTATVTVSTIAPFKPHVVLVRFTGTLPRQ